MNKKNFMRWIIGAFLAAILLLSDFSVIRIQAANEETYIVTANDYLTMRNGAGARNGEIARIPSGEKFTVTEKKTVNKSTWGKAVYKGKTGWVNIGYARRADAPVVSGELYIVNVGANDTLTVRSNAGVRYGEVRKIKNGQTITILKTKKAADGGTWGKLADGEWVNLAYCKKSGSGKAPAGTNTANKAPSASAASNTAGTNTTVATTCIKLDKSKKNGWYNENNVWKWYENGKVKFSSTAMHTAWRKINNKSSKTNYYLVVDRDNFRVFAFRWENKQWTPCRSMLCDVGKAGWETPTGTHEIFSRWGILKGGTWEYYPVEFLSNDNGAWCFHSILYYRGTELEDIANAKVYNGTLGAAISHGCVRLSLENAKWIYDTCLNGTKVLVY